MNAKPPSAELRAAFSEAAEFAAAVARTPPPADDVIQAELARELGGASVLLDQRGISPGAHAGVIAPSRLLWQRWLALRSVFLARLEPRRADMDAMQSLPASVAALEHSRAQDIETLRTRWQERPRNALITQQWETGQSVYEAESLRHGRRLATMAAYSPFYWAGLLLIGVAEWLINYDTFLRFTGVVAIAAGATIILAVLLAFAAHGHGELLKQWSYRFGRFQTQQNRVGSWRMLGLASFAVLVVLAAAGGSRYAAAIRSLSQTQQPDLIGGGYALEINPVRDVLLSLLANIAAWIVGVFISYFCHDVDPEFMAATWQHRRSGRAYFRARRRLESETQVIQEHTSREITALENAAMSRRTGSEAERGMAIQIHQHDAAVAETLLAHLRTGLRRYRQVLAERASGSPVKFAVTLPDGHASPLEADLLTDVPLLVDRDLLESLA